MQSSSRPLKNPRSKKKTIAPPRGTTSSSSTRTISMSNSVPWWFNKGWLFRPFLLLASLYGCVWIRLQAVRTYGKVIHEFDPWFNFRSTQYLVNNGWEKFSNWYDYESWYPLGRPVGHTIYPGLMVTAAKIYEILPMLGYPDISLNDVCVFIPAGFALLTCVATYLLTYEVTNGSYTSSTIACFIMSFIPAHLMRSVAGGYDNESVAVAAIVITFYLWVRSLRSSIYTAWIWGSLCGVSYVYLVSSWGAYIFALNMIGIHVTILMIFMNRFSFRLWSSYSCFYLIGTYGALQFPTVGLQPLQSMEQLGPLFIFGVVQIFAIADLYTTFINGQSQKNNKNYFKTRWMLLIAVGLLGAIVLPMYVPSSYVGPLSARVRGLFVRHTKTGNPLVDSVAEHQQTPSRVYWLYFHWTFYMTPIGFYLIYNEIRTNMSLGKNPILIEQQVFLLAYIAISYYFSSRMIRLVLLLSPATAISAGIVTSRGFHWAIQRVYMDEKVLWQQVEQRAKQDQEKWKQKRVEIENVQLKKLKKKPTPAFHAQINREIQKQKQQEDADLSPYALVEREWNDNPSFQKGTSYGVLLFVWLGAVQFVQHSITMSHHLSEPQIMTRIKDEESTNGIKIVDDFREAYWWLRDNTPKDSRIMAWWDYGYQINGIAERTTLADGNTWNHEHIALLGRTLVSNEKIAWETARHLADYVLCWSTRHGGIIGDDLAKMPHMARIAGSVYSDVNASDYFFVNREGELSNGIKNSMLYQVHSYGLDPDVNEPKYFEEAYTTEHSMVRIFKVKDVDEESKEWIRQHHTYPPALDHILEMKQDFRL